SASYTRNDLGRITRITDPNGNARDHTYDEMGRHTSSTDPLSNSTNYAYDSGGNISTVTYPAGAQQITRDEEGNITRRSYSDNTDLAFTYDDNNRLLTAAGLSLDYDAGGEITGCNGLTITRDDAGRIATITLAQGKVISYSYNGRGLVSRVSDWVGGATNLTYDDGGRVAYIYRPNGVRTEYTYDNDGRVTGITEKGSATLSSIGLTLDGAGNITSATRNIPFMPAPTSGSRIFTYDAASRVSGYTYDNMGRLTADETRTYVWDLASRLTSYTAGSNTIDFSYDDMGQRISRTSAGTTREYIWNYALALPSISVVREKGSDVRYYIHLPGGQLLHGIDAVNSTRSFYHFDEMGTTLFLTNESGDITDGYGHTPYGEVIQAGGTENPFTFLGAYGVMQEGNSGLYYMRARYYDGRAGRFISPDPVTSIHPRQVNPYQYAMGNPLRYADPVGLYTVDEARLAWAVAFLFDVRGSVGDTVGPLNGLAVLAGPSLQNGFGIVFPFDEDVVPLWSGSAPTKNERTEDPLFVVPVEDNLWKPIGQAQAQPTHEDLDIDDDVTEAEEPRVVPQGFEFVPGVGFVPLTWDVDDDETESEPTIEKLMSKGGPPKQKVESIPGSSPRAWED
ncbi:MAG: RHS repeat-associated core domain-containing protein, partial [Thermodesulfobacteriota bacterium]|nr:RHS repeat-associated core domain-containing protein [Thermodesulfobacteriota bacterium]